ncbi:MAG: invasion associated locus B family protein [Alphaproteobacteria bacterium]|nr:invasion associated locus B family protein [Alphaproteobacteria bacterium]MDE0940188.1 invasion associated locus B family protein [Pirellulales bacterium]
MTLRNLIFAVAFAMTATFATGTPSISQNADKLSSANGKPYLTDIFGAWEIRCMRLTAGGERCQMFQELDESPGNPVAEINIFALPVGQEAVLGAVIITPLGTLLTARLTLKISNLERKDYPFSWCNGVGCVARVGITADELDALKLGTMATITIVPVATPTSPMELSVSLQGFTSAFNAMQASNNPG